MNGPQKIGNCERCYANCTNVGQPMTVRCDRFTKRFSIKAEQSEEILGNEKGPRKTKRE